MAKKRKGNDEDAPVKAQKIPEKLNSPFAQALRAIATEKAEAAKKEAEAKAGAAKAGTEAGTQRAPKPGSQAAAPGRYPAPPRGAKAAKPVAPAAASTAKTPARAAPSSTPSAPKGPVDPMSHHAYEDRAAFHQAFAGVRSLDAGRGKKKDATRAAVSKEEQAMRAQHEKALDEADLAARARLEALVAGGVRFGITREDDGVYGVREGVKDTILRTLTGPTLRPEATLDLHGVLGAEVEREVARFVREHRAKGDRVVIIVHGKGLHSEGGVGVLDAHVVKALSEGAAAASVVAFATAPMRLGGQGALVVRLLER